MVNWTDEQVEIMNVAAKNGLTIEETSASLIEAGFENRSVKSVRAKWRHMYKAPFGDFNDEEIVVEEITEQANEEFVVETSSGDISNDKTKIIVVLGMVAICTTYLTYTGFISWG
jgi:hypothetical protein|tara:strand:+ start:114 stop:458 length:345 start_codon:yes stop_codon:yes gene_type:complete